MKEIFVTKNNGKHEVFDPQKLKASLIKAGASVFVADDIITDVMEELENGVSTHHIYSRAHSLLHKKESKIALAYSLKRSIMNLGPTGFPFEQYIAEIFKAKGYQTLTGVMVQGNCVVHEIDVIAFNDTELIMTEVKFHNELGLKSDLKVALYVKARFDDLRGKTFEYGGKQLRMTEGLLITNTKFTDRAIQYGACSGVNLIGWNYPIKGSLHDLIDQTGLHPLTCLTTITQAEKKLLIDQKITNCKSLAEKPEILNSLISDPERIKTTLEEVKNVCY